MAEPLVTYRGTVYPWHCDHVGHMNVMSMNLNQVTVAATDVARAIDFYATLGLRLIVKNLPEAAQARERSALRFRRV